VSGVSKAIEKPFFVSAFLAYGLYLAVTVVSNLLASVWFGFSGVEQGPLGFAISWFPSLLILGASLTFWKMSKFVVPLLLVIDVMLAYFLYLNEDKAEAIQNLTAFGASLGYTAYAAWLFRLGKLT
jgi:hypothetical protein